MEAFTNALLSAEPAIPGIDRSIIIPARRLHLTLGVMSLQSSSRGAENSVSNNTQPRPPTLAYAISLLDQLKPQVMALLGQERLRVAFRSLDIMKPERRDLERAHVMWVGPSADDDDTRRLKEVAELIHKTFKDAGLVVDEGRPLKLHCTVLNTIYRKPRAKGRQPFSYKSMLSSTALEGVIAGPPPGAVRGSDVHVKGPASVDLGAWDIDEIQICEMGSWGPEGEYVCVGRCALR